MKKVFISQPMRGKSKVEILEEREELIIRAEELWGDIEVLYSCFDDFGSENWTPLRYLAESIKLLSEADGVIFGKGWENARGCRIEHTCATEYGIDTLTVIK